MKRTFRSLRWLLNLLVVGISVYSSDSAQGQQTSLLKQYIHRIWTNNDGLPHNSARAIVQTQDGYIWIATQNGLARFNGAVFQVYNKDNTPALKHNDITSLVEGTDGTLWIGTYNGLTSLKRGVFTSHPTNAGREHELIRGLAIDHEGAIWIGTMNAGLHKYKDGQFEFFRTSQDFISNTTFAIAEDHKGNLWIGTNAGVSFYHQGQWSHYNSRNGLPNETVRSLFASSDSSVWIGTTGGLVKWKDGLFHTYTTANGLSNNIVRSIYEDHSGKMWIGTQGGGICQFSDGVFTSYTPSDGLSGDVVVAILEDHENNYWVGTYNTGLNQFWKGKFLNYTLSDGLSSRGATSIIQTSDGKIWIGSGGLQYFDGKRFTTIDTKKFLSNNSIRSFFEDSHGLLWIGTEDGLMHYHNGGLKTFGKADGLTQTYIRAIGEDNQGNIWVGTQGGVHRLEKGRFVNYLNKGFPMKVIRSILVDHSNGLWVGSNEVLKCWRKDTIITYTQKDGLPAEPIYAMMEDAEHTLWMGSYGGGLVRYRKGVFTRYTQAQGLWSDIVYQVLEDDRGYLWMSGLQGISCVSKQMLNDFAEGRIDHIHCTGFTSSDGMVSSECSGNVQSAGCKTFDGRLWFTTPGGVVVVDPNNLYYNLPLPPVMIERVVMNRREYSSLEGAQVPPGNGEAEFYYCGLSYRVPEKVNFRYKLDGYDDEWREAETRRWTSYTNLSPGKYVFHVIASNSDGVWNETGASLAFELEPHFYQTYWFSGLLVVVIGGIVFSVYRLRVRQLVKRKKELEQHILDRKAVEDALTESEERYRRLVEFSPEAIAVHCEGKFIFVNPAAVKLFGAKNESELIGKSFIDFIHPEYEEIVSRRIAKGMEEGKALPLMEEKFIRLDGGIIDVQVASLPIFLKGKTAMQVVASDITEQKRLRVELVQSQKMQSIGTLAGGIAHDFNNILGIVLGYTGLLQKHSLDAHKLSESIMVINQTVQRGAALVRQILTFARKTDTAFEQLDVVELVHEILLMLKETFPRIIAFAETFYPDTPCISADRTQIHQAILNLCVNARDAMPLGGTITVKVEEQLKEHVRERFPEANEDSYVCISVADTGEGMDEATRIRVFEPFFTTKAIGKGTGMGLSVVYGVVQTHHGFIDLESELGRGTMFRLYFPVLAKNKQTVDDQKPIESFDIGGNETILLVEDEEFLLELVRILLESKGYKVYSTKDGIEAMEIYKSNENEIDLVFTDMGLPGLTGMEEFRKLKEINPDVKVIFASGFFEPEVRSELLKAGAKGFVQKPYISDDVLRKLREVLDKR